jgi:hypothetical protein
LPRYSKNRKTLNDNIVSTSPLKRSRSPDVGVKSARSRTSESDTPFRDRSSDRNCDRKGNRDFNRDISKNNYRARSRSPDRYRNDRRRPRSRDRHRDYDRNDRRSSNRDNVGQRNNGYSRRQDSPDTRCRDSPDSRRNETSYAKTQNASTSLNAKSSDVSTPAVPRMPSDNSTKSLHKGDRLGSDTSNMRKVSQNTGSGDIVTKSSPNYEKEIVSLDSNSQSFVRNGNSSENIIAAGHIPLLDGVVHKSGLVDHSRYCKVDWIELGIELKHKGDKATSQTMKCTYYSAACLSYFSNISNVEKRADKGCIDKMDIFYKSLSNLRSATFSMIDKEKHWHPINSLMYCLLTLDDIMMLPFIITLWF